MVTKGKTKPSQGNAKKPTRNPTTQELLTHRIADKKLNPQKQPFTIHSYAISQETEQTLVHLKQDATDHIGQTVSNSALIRAAVPFLAQQPAAWIAKQIHPLIEEEIAQGRLWDTKERKTADREEIGGETTKYDRLFIRVGKQKG